MHFYTRACQLPPTPFSMGKLSVMITFDFHNHTTQPITLFDHGRVYEGQQVVYKADLDEKDDVELAIRGLFEPPLINESNGMTCGLVVEMGGQTLCEEPSKRVTSLQQRANPAAPAALKVADCPL